MKKDYIFIYLILLTWLIMGVYVKHAQSQTHDFLGVTYTPSDTVEFKISRSDTIQPNFIYSTLKSKSLMFTFYFYVYKGDSAEAAYIYDSLYSHYENPIVDPLENPRAFSDSLSVSAYFQILADGRQDTADVNRALREFNRWVLPESTVGVVRMPGRVPVPYSQVLKGRDLLGRLENEI